MIESYEKRGVSVRVEKSGRSTSTVVAREHGRAFRERGRFRAESCGERPLAVAPDVAGAVEVARRLSALETHAAAIERMTVMAGIAEHAIEFGKERCEWTESVARVHLSLVNPERELRVSVSLGADRIDALQLEHAAAAASALGAAAPHAPPFHGVVQLAPPVSAAMWVFLCNHPSLVAGSRLLLEQSTHPAWPFDGAGRKVELHAVDGATPVSLFRPSYRTMPAATWFHVRASVRGVGRLSRRAGAHVAALLSPFRLTRTSLAAEVIAGCGEATFAATLEIPRDGFGEAIQRISRRAAWFPEGAGAWGSATLAAGATLTPTA